MRLGQPGVEALPPLIDILAANEIRTCVVLHSTLSELATDGAAFAPLETVVAPYDVPIVYMRDLLADREPVADLYGDDIHITDAGQAILAEALLACDRAASVPNPNEAG